MFCERSGAVVKSRSAAAATEASTVLEETSLEIDKVMLKPLDAGDIIAVTPTINQQKTMAPA